MSQAYDSKKSLDITQFSRDQQNKSVEEYQLAMIDILNTLSSKEKQDLIISLLGLLAKESKQLPDNHQVTVSNPTDVSTIATEETLELLVNNQKWIHKLLDDSTSTEYYLFVSNDYDFTADTGYWKVVKITATETFYCFGSDDYQTAWTNRVSLIYN